MNIPESTSTSFPSVYLTSSLIDNRVPYWAPLKFAAKLRAALPWSVEARASRGGDSAEEMVPPVLRNLVLEVRDDQGHYGEGGRHARLEELTKELTFLESELGLT